MNRALATGSLLGCLWLLSPCVLCSQATASVGAAAEAPLTTQEQQRLETAKAAVRKSPQMKEATAKFNAARKAYQLDRAKFPAERSKEAVVLPVQEKVGRPNDVHFQPEGYQLLAQAVAASIEAQSPKAPR